jgi:ribosomal protein S18 acetylase RimI-like enzyme
MAIVTKLRREEWKGHILRFEYTTGSRFAVSVSKSRSGWTLELSEKALPEPVQKEFESRLFEPFLDVPAAYCAEEGNEILAWLETNHEAWNNRIRITNFLVEEGHRRKGLGTAMMDKAKDVARHAGARAIVLETQSCNAGAIRFCLSQGFQLCGLDLYAYSNEDIEAGEVRIELIHLL